jgi:hypothetical protein
VRPTAAEFALRAADRGAYVVRVRVPGARTVELVGDFTGWKPVAMSSVSTDEWEATIAMTPGVHRLNLRVDGDAWRAPPGIETVEDEFNGQVGVIVIE